MGDFIKRVFCDESGNPSSARVIGSILCLAGIVAYFVVGEKASASLLTSGVALLSVGQVKSAVIGAAQANATATPLPPAIPANPSAVNPAANEVPPPTVPTIVPLNSLQSAKPCGSSCKLL